MTRRDFEWQRNAATQSIADCAALALPRTSAHRTELHHFSIFSLLRISSVLRSLARSFVRRAPSQLPCHSLALAFTIALNRTELNCFELLYSRFVGFSPFVLVFVLVIITVVALRIVSQFRIS